jgi:hypothetical protein
MEKMELYHEGTKTYSFGVTGMYQDENKHVNKNAINGSAM